MKPDALYSVLRGMIREEIDRTPGFRELAGSDPYPANIQAEKAILGAIMLDNAAYAQVAGKLVADEFSLDSHCRIFHRMAELNAAKRAVDIVTLTEELRKHHEIKEIGGVAYLASLTEGLPRKPVLDDYIRIVKEKARLRRIWRACEAAIESCKEQSQSASDIVEQLGNDLKGIKERK